MSEGPAIPRPELPPLKEREERGRLFKLIAGLLMILGLALTSYGLASALINICRRYGLSDLEIPILGLTILFFGIALFSIFKRIGLVS